MGSRPAAIAAVVAQRHRAEAERGDHEPGAAEVAVGHGPSVAVEGRHVRYVCFEGALQGWEGRVVFLQAARGHLQVPSSAVLTRGWLDKERIVVVRYY